MGKDIRELHQTQAFRYLGIGGKRAVHIYKQLRKNIIDWCVKLVVILESYLFSKWLDL